MKAQKGNIIKRMNRLASGSLACGMSLLIFMNAVSADSVMSAGRAYGVYGTQGQTSSSSTSDSGWSPKFGDFYDAYQQIKQLVKRDTSFKMEMS